MSNYPDQNPVSDGTGQSLMSFQLTTAKIKDKSSLEYGKAISKYIASTCTFNTGSYYFLRNARFIKNRNYANGQLNIQQMFQDRFQFNGKQNYIALNFNALQLVNRIVSGLVGRWMRRQEKIQIKAVDDLSQTQKQEEYELLQLYIEQREKLEELQKQSGVQILPQEGIPEDSDMLQIWKAELQRLPEEILTEMGCNDVLASNGCYDVMKEKLLHDAAETFFVGTYTWMDSDGIIHVRDVKPENAIYSFTEKIDLRDTTWRGEAPTIKISELRRQWGKEFNPDNEFALDEKQIWKIAQSTAKEFQYQTNLGWNDIYYTSFYRPYDEWNVRSLQFEVKTVDSEPYTVTKTKTNGRTYTQKGLPTTQSGKVRDKPLENQNIIGDTNWNIYRGVYLPDSDTLIEWGLKDNMVRPQDPREIGNAEFSYSFVMPQNYMMRNLAVPEKIEAAIDGMILACLKIQQDIASSIPPGWVIDETALQNIDYGLGDDGNKAVDQSKLFFQTGKMFYRGLDAEGNRVPVPIQEIANSGFAAHIQAFITTYQFWYQTLKDELGEDPNLISASLQPRVTAQNVEASQLQAEYATDQYYRAYAECMKITARKVSCLLKDSVMYGAKAYRHIVNKEDIDKRIFTTDIRFLPTDFEVQRFEAILNQTIATNQDIVMFIDPFKLMRVAKEDVKLAELLFRNAQKKMLMWQRQVATENQQQTIDGQIKSAQAAEQAKGENMEMELESKERLAEAQGKVEKEKIVLQGVFAIAQLLAAPKTMGGEGATTSAPNISALPPSLMELMELSIKNIAIPLAKDNKQMVNGVIQQDQMEQQQAMEQQEQINQQQQQQVAA